MNSQHLALQYWIQNSPFLFLIILLGWHSKFLKCVFSMHYLVVFEQTWEQNEKLYNKTWECEVRV